MALMGVPPAVFMREGNPDDPRAQRTRRQLLSAYEHELRVGRQVDSVAALTRAAGVSRSSFYCHFSGVDEVGLAAMRQLLDEFEGTVGLDRSGSECAEAVVPDRPAASLPELFRHLAQHREICRALLTNESGRPHPAYDEFRAVLTAHFVCSFEKTQVLPRADAATTATFVVGGLLALLGDWLTDPHGDPEKLATVVGELLPSWLSRKEFVRPLRVVSQRPRNDSAIPPNN